MKPENSSLRWSRNLGRFKTSRGSNRSRMKLQWQVISDTVDGAKASAVVYSIMLTCRACGVEPLAYLRHVLSELPQRADISDLLPFNFPKAAAA